jgi:hypothetical protein
VSFLDPEAGGCMRHNLLFEIDHGERAARVSPCRRALRPLTLLSCVSVSCVLCPCVPVSLCLCVPVSMLPYVCMSVCPCVRVSCASRRRAVLQRESGVHPDVQPVPYAD